MQLDVWVHAHRPALRSPADATLHGDVDAPVLAIRKKSTDASSVSSGASSAGDDSDGGDNSDDDDGFPIIAAAEGVAMRHARPWQHTWDDNDFSWTSDLTPRWSAAPRKSALRRGLEKATSFFADVPGLADVRGSFQSSRAAPPPPPPPPPPPRRA